MLLGNSKKAKYIVKYYGTNDSSTFYFKRCLKSNIVLVINSDKSV